ncbi:MAG: hypothetical protein M0P91_02855 [Sulfuricurvum sp.]|uniref:hypothetical protein n=1 Tax=Sulfuricurvum sp. TaxID=2025608 RepID=UPI0025F37A3F|nr:hypothetical protein [Sulfuricurvum sp.]MCK9372112.1 hypothetical protein [Sulfuricurvum sp.]
MSIYALQSPAGGFLDEDLKFYNKIFDEWCVQFDNYDDARLIADTLDRSRYAEVVEITPLSYPKYFFHNLQGIIHATREIDGNIICIVEPFTGSYFRIAVCNLMRRSVKLTPSKYKSSMSVEGAFANFKIREHGDNQDF